MTHLDYIVLPLHRKEGQDHDFLPGFLSAKAPRRASRARKGDQLWLYVSFSQSLPYTNLQLQELLDDMAKGYFQNSGSATSALLEQIDRLNAFLFDQNQKEGQGDGTAIAHLSIFLLRPTRLILAQSGPVHAFQLGSTGVEHLYDPDNAGRGLGLARQSKARFYDLALGQEDIFLVTHSIPEGWNEQTLQDIQGQRIATLRRRFLGDAGNEISAVMMAMKEGTGKLEVLGNLSESAAAGSNIDGGASGLSPAEAFIEAAPENEGLDESSWEQIEVPSERAPAQVSSTKSDDDLSASMPTIAQSPGEERDRWREYLASGLAILGRQSRRIQAWLGQILPDDGEFNLPSSTMAWIAGLVPLAVVLIVTLLYFQVGRGQLYVNYLNRAQAAIAEATALEDTEQARLRWEEALQFSQQAQSYDDNADVSAALLQAQSALDELDAIVRLDFQLALFDQLDSDVNIQRMLATNTELYMLNSENGEVLRAFLTGGGYQLDTSFQCGPGPYGGLSIGPLIDIALMPSTNPQEAALLGMDAKGNLVYCIIDERPIANSLEAPQSGWGQPSAITLENGNLYVLDPLTNAVWIYPGEDFAFVDSPAFFFGLQVPNVKAALDLALNENDLYLLENEGQLAFCTYSGDLEDPAQCEEPAQFQDGRPGREDGPSIAGSLFLQLQATDPPEPSIYFFDPVSQSIFQFSLRLSLVRQYRSSEDLPEGLGTAFAVSPNRALFLAIGNQLYIAFLP